MLRTHLLVFLQILLRLIYNALRAKHSLPLESQQFEKLVSQGEYILGLFVRVESLSTPHRVYLEHYSPLVGFPYLLTFHQALEPTIYEDQYLSMNLQIWHILDALF